MNSWSMPPSSLNIDWLEEIEVGQLLLAQQPVVSPVGGVEALYAECLARFMTDTGEVLRAERFYQSVLHQPPLSDGVRRVLRARGRRHRNGGTFEFRPLCRGDAPVGLPSWPARAFPIGSAPMRPRVDA